MPNTYFDSLYSRTKRGAKTPISGNDLLYRPKSLSGIENNNGWTKIDSREDLPKYEGMYLFMFTDGRYVEQWHQDDVSIGGVTHWRPVIEIPKPLY